MRTPEYKTLRQLVEGIREEAPNGELMFYHKFPDGSISGRLCPKCGAHMANWKEVFGTDHTCP